MLHSSYSGERRGSCAVLDCEDKKILSDNYLFQHSILKLSQKNTENMLMTVGIQRKQRDLNKVTSLPCPWK